MTFYGFFKQDAPHGRLRIWVCRSISCHLRGADEVLAYLCQRTGIQPGETTPDGGLTVEFAECLGACEQAPCVLAGDTLHACLTKEKLDQMLGIVEVKRGRSWQSSNPFCWRTSTRPDSHTLAAYEATGGYRTWRTVLAEQSPQDVQDLVKASGLRGRGGAGFPTGLKWTFLPKDHPGPIYFCLNADESEPGTFNNRILMEHDPHQVLEGLIISCYATRATTAYFYLRYEYPLAYQRVQAAIDECYAAGYLGKNILGTDYLAGYLPAPRRRGLHLRRGDRPDREPGRQAGLAADQAAVSGRRRCVSQADGRQQRRDGGLRHAHLRPRRPTWFRSIGVPPDPDQPARSGQLRPEAVLPQRTRRTSPAATKRRWA